MTKPVLQIFTPAYFFSKAFADVNVYCRNKRSHQFRWPGGIACVWISCNTMCNISLVLYSLGIKYRDGMLPKRPKHRKVVNCFKIFQLFSEKHSGGFFTNCSCKQEQFKWIILLILFKFWLSKFKRRFVKCIFHNNLILECFITDAKCV